MGIRVDSSGDGFILRALKFIPRKLGKLFNRVIKLVHPDKKVKAAPAGSSNDSPNIRDRKVSKIADHAVEPWLVKTTKPANKVKIDRADNKAPGKDIPNRHVDDHKSGATTHGTVKEKPSSATSVVNQYLHRNGIDIDARSLDLIKKQLPEAWGTQDLCHKLHAYSHMNFFECALSVNDFIDAYSQNLISRAAVDAATKGAGVDLPALLRKEGARIKEQLHPPARQSGPATHRQNPPHKKPPVQEQTAPARVVQKLPANFAPVVDALNTRCQLTVLETQVLQNQLSPVEVGHPEFARCLTAFRALKQATDLTMEHDFTELYRMGLIQYHLETIEEARGSRRALQNVREDINGDKELLHGKIVQSGCDITKNTGAYVGRLDNGCWSSTGIQFLLSSRDEQDILELERALNQGGFPLPSQRKIAQALVDMWRISQRVRRKELPPICMVGHQRRLITGCYEYRMATKGQGGITDAALKDLFDNGPFDGIQHDAEEFYSAVNDILPISHGRAANRESVRIKATYQGQAVSRLGAVEAMTHAYLPVPEGKTSVMLLAEVLSDQEAQGLSEKQYVLPEHTEIRDALLAYRWHLKNAKESEGEGEKNAALGRLYRAVDSLCRSVRPSDSIIIDGNGKLLVDSHETDGSNRTPKGTHLPEQGVARDFRLRIANVTKNNAEVKKLRGGGQVLVYPDGASPQEIADMKRLMTHYEPECFCRPIARVDRDGRLLEPCLVRTKNMSGLEPPHQDLLAPGQLVLDSSGRYFGESTPGLQKGERVIPPDLANKMRRERMRQSSPDETLSIVTDLSSILGYDLKVSDQLRQQASGPSMGQAIREYMHESDAGSKDWSRKHLLEANVPVPNCPSGSVNLPSTQSQVRLASKDDFQKISIKLNGLSFIDQERVFRKGDSKSLIMNGGEHLELPMEDENGEKFTFRGRLTALACHAGASSSGTGGHYINLKIDANGKVHVMDELYSLPLEGYAQATGRKLPNGQHPKNLQEFLSCTDFVPQIAFYERVEN